MKLFATIVLILFAGGIHNAAAQTLPLATPAPSPPIFEIGSPEGARIRREQAYAKLLEGQRFVWNTHRLQTQAGKANSMKLAKLAFQRAVEYDPTLSEGYTALAELAVGMTPADIEESIRLATTATTVEPSNFGGRRMLARLYTVKSRVNAGPLDPVFAAKAIDEWKYVTRLDPRNAEGWAFLSVFSEKKNQNSEHIESLRKWIASAAPIDIQFYTRIMGPEANLAPESASLQLAAAFIKAERKDEAVETLSSVIAADPDNAEAIELLSEAVDSTEGGSAEVAVKALQQAVFSNPANVSLVDMLARLQNRIGRFDESVKLLRTNAEKLGPTNNRAASTLLVALGDLYIEKDLYKEAVDSFQNSLTIRGISIITPLPDEDREFAMFVFEKLIQAYKFSNRPSEVRSVIEFARTLLGKNDLFADRQLIAFYRSTGNKIDALAVIRSVRERIPNDNGFMRLEASLLAETGKVEAAVAMIRNEISQKAAANPVGSKPSETDPEPITVQLPAYDEFSSRLFISNLYSKANRGKEAVDAADQAFAVAIGSERKQIAKLTLATAQQMAGDFSGAESTLRGILKQTPGNPIALNNLGYFLIERGERLTEALKLIQQALKVDPKNPSYLDSLGWAFFKLGKLDEAEKFLKDALRIDTDSATIYEHLGDVYMKKQNRELAKAAWEKAFRMASDAVDTDRLKKKLKN